MLVADVVLEHFFYSVTCRLFVQLILLCLLRVKALSPMYLNAYNLEHNEVAIDDSMFLSPLTVLPESISEFRIYYIQESLCELPWMEWQKGELTICCNGWDRHETILMSSSVH